MEITREINECRSFPLPLKAARIYSAIAHADFPLSDLTTWLKEAGYTIDAERWKHMIFTDITINMAD